MKARHLPKAKKCALGFVLIVVLSMIGESLFGADRYCRNTGDWNNTNTWSETDNGSAGASVPVAGDNVYISRGRTVTIPSGYNAECDNLFPGNATAGRGTMTLATNSSLTVSGVVTLGGSGGTGEATYARGILVFGSGSVMIVSGAITVGYDLNRYGSLDFSSGGTLKIGSSITINNIGSFIPGSGTIDYSGAAQTIASSTLLTQPYNNLTLSGSGVKTISNVTVNGIISMEGTATASSVITAGSAATLQYKGSSLQTTGPEFGLLDGTPPTRTFGGTGGVIIDNANGVALGSNSSIANTLNLVNGSFTIGNNILTLYGPPISGTSSNLQSSSGSSLSIVSNSSGLFVPSSITSLNSLSVISSTGVTINIDFHGKQLGVNYE